MRITDAKTARLVANTAYKNRLKKQYEKQCSNLTLNEKREYELLVAYIETEIASIAEEEGWHFQPKEEEISNQMTKYYSFLMYIFGIRGFKVKFDGWTDKLDISWYEDKD